MARVSVQMSTEGGTHFVSTLIALGDRLEDVPKIAAVVFEGLEKYHEARWGEGVVDTAETDARWPAHGPLRNTGALRDSMTKMDAAGAIREFNPLEIKFGSRLEYAKYLQGGTRKMEKKPVLRLRAARALVGKLVREYVMRGV